MKNQFKTILLAAGVAFSAYGADPYQGTNYTKLNGPALDLFLSFPAIPAGKRLILEHTGIRMWVDSGAKVTCTYSAAAPQASGLGMPQYFLDMPKLMLGTGLPGGYGGGANSGQDFLGIDQSLKLYVDAAAGSSLTLHCTRNFGSQPWTVLATIVGVLVDAAAPVTAP